MQKLVCKAVAIVGLAFGATAQAAVPEWIEQSNANAQPLLELMAKYAPESAAAYGVEGHDADIVDLQPGYDVRMEADIGRVDRRPRGQVADDYRSPRRAGSAHPGAGRPRPAGLIGFEPPLDAAQLRSRPDAVSELPDVARSAHGALALPGRARTTAQVRRSRGGLSADHGPGAGPHSRAFRDDRTHWPVDRSRSSSRCRTSRASSKAFATSSKRAGSRAGSGILERSRNS